MRGVGRHLLCAVEPAAWLQNTNWHEAGGLAALRVCSTAVCWAPTNPNALNFCVRTCTLSRLALPQRGQNRRPISFVTRKQAVQRSTQRDRRVMRRPSGVSSRRPICVQEMGRTGMMQHRWRMLAMRLRTAGSVPNAALSQKRCQRRLHGPGN